MGRNTQREWKWGINEVWQYLNDKNVSIPIRTDCARCFYQRIGEWYELWLNYPDIYKDAVKQEKDIGHTWMTPGKHKIWPHQLVELAKEFKKGRKPTKSLNRLSNDRQCRVCSL